MLEISNPKDIDDALFKYHSTLASTILKELSLSSFKRIVEIGSGPGTFTIPFVEKLNNKFEILYCIDSYTGPYKHDNDILRSKLADHGLEGQLQIIKRDARDLDRHVSDIDLIIGHEVLSDLTLLQVEQLITASFNTLNKGGFFIHSEFSPIADNKSEELLHIINEYSQEPISDTQWFSPPADELIRLANHTGFESVQVKYKKIPIRFTHDAAIEMLARWKIKQEFLKIYSNKLEKIGIEYPSEQILICEK